MFTHLYRQSISCILSSVLLGNALYAGGVVVDTTAAQKYQAQTDTTANGIPLINIVKPDTGGLSHNKFSDFNINPSGLILNNATSAVQTQLGGYVQGNNNLGTTPARVILNEVTGTNRSYLQGYGEVAGAAADVIVANPNGITVNGGGFINTPHTTLTTGTPEFSGSTLSGFHVQRGDILIEGAGLNADNIDRVDLYTKALQLNGQIYAKKLDVVTGENHISTDGTVTSDNVTGTKEFSIDSSALGGIYANIIRLVGTDKGVGVNLPQITYASDALELTADGKIIIGKAYAQNRLDVTSNKDSILLKNELGANLMTLTASSTITNEGILVGTTVHLHAQDMDNLGTMYADTMNIQAEDSLINTGILSAYTDLTATATNMTNGSTALIESQNATLNISHSVQNSGMIHASALSIVTPTLTNASNIIADTLSIDGADVTNNGLLKGDTSTRITVSNSITNNGGIIGGNQLTLHASQITNNQVLYSANAIDLSAADTLRNTQGSSIISDGTISIHDTGTLSNEAATIQSGGDMNIQAGSVENLSSMTPTVSNQHTPRYVTRMVTRSGGGSNWDWDDLYTEKWTDTIDKTLYTPSYILAGGNIGITAATHNHYSMIAADGDIYLAGSLTNEAAVNAHDIIETQYYYDREHQSCGWRGCHWYNDSYWGALTHSDTITDHAYSTIQAGGSIYGNLISINNADVVAGTPVVSFSSHTIPTSPTISAISIHDIAYTLPSGNYGQFVTASNPAHPYLIESNPLYTNYNTFIGSDYIMSRLNLNMAADTKRLGDARYETQLVHDAVFRLTGERYLAGFGSDTAEYKALMDNALAVSSDLHLALGVSLSAAQVAALNKDIVWMEERIVAGQKVLVPVVYLASLKTAELSGGGKIIAGGDMQLSVTNRLNNAGEIRAGGTLIAVADSIANMGGSLKGTGDMFLHTTNDITNTSGTIAGNNVALISDNGNIVSKTALKSIDLSNRAGISGNLSTVGEQAFIQATGDMLLQAKNDITITGGSTSSGGNTTLTSTTGNVTLASLEQNSHTKTSWSQGSSEIESVKQHATTVNATGDISINSAKDVTLTSSSIDGKNVALVAGGNVNITAANDREFMDVQIHNKKKGLLGSTTTNTQDMTNTSTSVASHIGGETVSINSAKDITVQGSDVVSNSGTSLSAAHDINILSGTNTRAESHFKEVKKSGLFVNDSAGVTSVGYTKSKNTSNDNLQSTQAVASNVVSLNGDTTIQANNHLQVSGSNLEAGKDLNLVAKSIDILEAHNTLFEQYSQQTSSKGFSIGTTRSPYLALKSAYQGAKGNTPATGGVMNKLSREFEGSNAGAGAASTPMVITAHSTTSSTNGTQETSSATASTLTAGGNLNIIATDGSINSQGTQMSAEGNALLLAKENINLNVAHSSESASSNTSSHGFTLDNRASANTPDQIAGVYNKHSIGAGVTDTITGTQLSIGGSATLGTTVGDIAITGGNVVANGDVNLNAARNLIIQTSQNTTDNKNTSNDKAIGKVTISDTERFSGYHTELHKDNGMDGTQVSSNVTSLGGDVNLNAGDAYTQSASNVMAARDVNILAKTIDLTTADNTGTSSVEDKALKIGGFARVSSPLIDLVNSVDTAGKSDGRLQTMQEMAVAANAYRAGSAISNTTGGAGSGSIVSAEVGVGFTTKRSSENTSTNQAQASTINGGNNVTLTTTEGDIHATGAAITAGQTLSLDSAKDIILDAAENIDHSDGKNSAYGAEVGVGVSVGAKTGVYAYVGVQASHGKSLSDSTTYNNTHLTADTINLKANDNLTLAGADARANTINADAGKVLTIESLQDTAKSTSNESGMNLKVQVSIGTAWGASGGANAAQAKGNYQSVNQQSGLFAEDGGYHVNVGGNTNLIGGVISSSDKAIADNKNTLTTATLTTTDLENHSSYSAEAVAVSGGSDFNKANINGAGVGIETGSQTSLTRSAISQGTITITDDTKQLSLSGKTAQETIASINTDTAHAHTALEPLPDLKVLLNKQQAMATATLTVVQTGVQVAQDIKDGKNVLGDASKIVGGNTINAIALAGNIITGNMDVDNAIKSFQDPYKMSEALKTNPSLAASLDAFTKGQFDNLPKTKEGLQTLADATGLNVNVLLITVTNYQDAKGTTDGKLIALDVNEQNRQDTLSTLGHEINHARGGTNETLADMSGYATQLLSEVAINSYDQQYLNGIKFELGTGNNTATQAANQVLLGNDNQALLNALNDHQLEFYLKPYEDPRLNNFYGTKTGISPEEKAGFIQGVKNVNTFSTAAAISFAKDREPKLATFFGVTGLISEYILLRAGDTNFAEVSRGQMIDQLPGESPRAQIVKEVAKEITKQTLPVDKN